MAGQPPDETVAQGCRCGSCLHAKTATQSGKGPPHQIVRLLCVKCNMRTTVEMIVCQAQAQITRRFHLREECQHFSIWSQTCLPRERKKKQSQTTASSVCLFWSSKIPLSTICEHSQPLFFCGPAVRHCTISSTQHNHPSRHIGNESSCHHSNGFVLS